LTTPSEHVKPHPRQKGGSNHRNFNKAQGNSVIPNLNLLITSFGYLPHIQGVIVSKQEMNDNCPSKRNAVIVTKITKGTFSRIEVGADIGDNTVTLDKTVYIRGHL